MIRAISQSQIFSLSGEKKLPIYFQNEIDKYIKENPPLEVENTWYDNLLLKLTFPDARPTVFFDVVYVQRFSNTYSDPWKPTYRCFEREVEINRREIILEDTQKDKFPDFFMCDLIFFVSNVKLNFTAQCFSKIVPELVPL